MKPPSVAFDVNAPLKMTLLQRLCNFTKATIYIPVSASLKAVGKQEPFSDGHKPDNSITQHLLQPQPSFFMQCRGCCCYIPCIMQLPAHVQLSGVCIGRMKAAVGAGREWLGLSCAELCPGVSEQGTELGPAQGGGAAALAAFGFGW